MTQTGQALISETEKLLDSWKHPDPYIPPTAPGGTHTRVARQLTRNHTDHPMPGSKYERNLPCPILDRESPPLMSAAYE